MRTESALWDVLDCYMALNKHRHVTVWHCGPKHWNVEILEKEVGYDPVVKCIVSMEGESRHDALSNAVDALERMGDDPPY